MEYCSKEISTAIEKKDYVQLEEILSSSPSLIDYRNGFPIKSALFHNDEVMIQYLIEKGANFRLSDDYLLRHACDKGLFSTVKLLVEKGSKISVLDCSPFVNAVINSHWNIADYLLEQDKLGLIKKANNIYTRTVSKNGSAFQYLLKKGFIIDDINKLLIDSIRSDNKEGIDYCLDQGADINKLNPNPLSTAIIEKKEDIAFYLINKSCDIHINQEEPLALACQSGSTKLVQYFIEQGCLVHSRNNLVKRAVLANNPSLVKLLIEHQQNPHLEDEKALIKAIEKNYVPIVDILLTQDCNLNIGNGVLLKKAIFTKNIDIIEKLLIENIEVSENLKKIAKQHNLLEFINNILIKKSFHDSLLEKLDPNNHYDTTYCIDTEQHNNLLDHTMRQKI